MICLGAPSVHINEVKLLAVPCIRCEKPVHLVVVIQLGFGSLMLKFDRVLKYRRND